MNYVITGIVVKGDQYGRKLGYPTVNLKLDAEETPPQGVYSGTAVLEGKEYRAGILINPNGKVEAHLIGYNGDAYGKVVTLRVEKFLRHYKKFDTEEELILQIKKDIEQC
ncbi:MAG TPA: riboflavin kinase [Candidatus Paceibacterota bacterium]